MPKPDDTKATQQQWIQGIQDHKASHTLDGTVDNPLDYKRAIQCLDQGANAKDYNFECMFVPMPYLSVK
ncbi:hypothetical protein ACHAPV_002774 [Trichoderma viride]